MELTIIDAETNSFSASKGIKFGIEAAKYLLLLLLSVTFDPSEMYQYAASVFYTLENDIPMRFSSQRLEI